MWEDPIYRNFSIFPYTGAKLQPELSISFARSTNWAPDHRIAGAEWNNVDGDSREKKDENSNSFLGRWPKFCSFFSVI